MRIFLQPSDNRDKIIGIGEVGLDYYWVKESEKRKHEMKNFKRFIELSNELDLPLVVHSRDAEEDVIKMLRDFDTGAILHCFGGSVKLAEEAVMSGRNEPINLKLSVQKIADIKGVDIAVVEDTTTENAKRFFNLV
ncbi:MAG: hypothetical protein B6U86_06170 [Candidatus Altiarchaeales archaeon ex4484_43]|nr:MAG: hypothetical protein B6U86_06170 [Candidatus Altiarchaeales archaeon ex4484_43]